MTPDGKWIGNDIISEMKLFDDLLNRQSSTNRTDEIGRLWAYTKKELEKQ